MQYIYEIKNIISGKIYIGSSNVFPTNRWAQHMNGLKNGYHKNELLNEEWKNFPNFTCWNFRILECVDGLTSNALLRLEAEYILNVLPSLRLNTPNRTTMTEERNQMVQSMLEDGFTYDYIMEKTKLSKTTISEIRNRMDTIPPGRYKPIHK